jgi:hypothetical protein
MARNEVSDGLPGLLRTAIVGLVRREGPDLSARQLGVFLTCYLETEAQTVRGLAARLNVSKPVITRALDRLSEFDPVRRKGDPLDRRSVLVQQPAWRSSANCGRSFAMPRRPFTSLSNPRGAGRRDRRIYFLKRMNTVRSTEDHGQNWPCRRKPRTDTAGRGRDCKPDC